MSKLIAKLQEPKIDGNFLICTSDEKGVYLTKNEYLDASGKVEATSVGWSRIGAQQLRHLLSVHFGMTPGQITETMGRDEAQRQGEIAELAVEMLYGK